MGDYRQLTQEQRYGIYTLLRTGHNQTEIAAGIGEVPRVPAPENLLPRFDQRNPGGNGLCSPLLLPLRALGVLSGSLFLPSLFC